MFLVGGIKKEPIIEFPYYCWTSKPITTRLLKNAVVPCLNPFEPRELSWHGDIWEQLSKLASKPATSKAILGMSFV